METKGNKTSFDLSPEDCKKIQKLVKSGKYKSRKDFIDRAIKNRIREAKVSKCVGFVLISVPPECELEVLEGLRELCKLHIDHAVIVEAHQVFGGHWNVIAKVEADRFKDLERLVKVKIEKMKLALVVQTLCVCNEP